MNCCFIALGRAVVWGCALAFGLDSLSTACRGEDLYLADGTSLPGGLWRSDGGGAEQLLHRREPTANAAFSRAVMKLSQVAVSPDGKLFFCSGLDGYVMHLLDRRHEIALFEVPGQVRDVACTGEDHVVYFSVLDTPLPGTQLSDGKIYRRDLWQGSASEVATVRQLEVGGNWWGTFTIRKGKVCISTREPDSRIYQLSGSGGTRLLGKIPGHQILGLGVAIDGAFHFVSGDSHVYRTVDFRQITPVLTGGERWSDAALPAGYDDPRP